MSSILQSPKFMRTLLAVCASVVFALLYAVEGRPEHMPFVALILSALFGGIYLVSRRVYFSAYLSLGIVCMTTAMSVAKFRGQGFDLHVYDFAFTGTDVAALNFLASEYSNLVFPVVAALAIGIVSLVLIWRFETASKIHAAWRLTPLMIAAIGLPFAYPIKPSEPRYFYYLSGFNATSFYISFLDITDRFKNSSIITNMDSSSDVAPFALNNACTENMVTPDVFVVLSESATNFARTYPQLNIKNPPDMAFRSQDGALRDLRVETFGGGTWVSNLSFMTGLSSLDFGWRAPYLTVQMEGLIKQSIASTMNDCGYKTAAVMPMKDSFVNEGSFLRSIGFDEILDYDKIGASLYNHRDDFYFDAANEFIDQHIAEDGRPLFMQVQTMFAHSPFETPRNADIQFQTEPFSQDKLLNEHIRRVYISQNDFHQFLEQRKSAHPNRPFIVVEFGDHQTTGTRTMADAISNGNSLVDRNSTAYKTHYSIHSYKYDLDMSVFPDYPLDIAFLGVTLKQAAGFKLTPMFEDLAKLRDLCRGKFDDCIDRDAVNAHINRRIKSKLLTLPTS